MRARHTLPLLVAAAACGPAHSTSGATADPATCAVARLVTSTGAPPSGARVALALDATPNADGTQSIISGQAGAPTGEGDVCVDLSWTGATAPALSLVVGHEQQAYQFGPFHVAPSRAACGAGACTDLGVLALTADRRLPVAVCRIAGVVEDVNGAPVAGANVGASDASVPTAAAAVLCGPDPSLCQAGAVTDGAGRFAFPAVAAHGPSLHAWRLDTSDPIFDRTRSADLAVEGCPAAPLTLTASSGFDAVRNLVVTLEGLQISWSGGYRAGEIRVYRGDLAKWTVVGTSGGMASPVTYGVVPAGAEQRSGAGLTPLAAGDEIKVLVSGTAPDGFPLTGTGSLVVP